MLYILIGFIGMELAAYVLHRYLFHGILWKIHKTHHESNPHTFEWNDLFSVGFAAASLYLMYDGGFDFGNASFGIGLGIAIYGILYFIIHDLFTHRRFYPFSSDNKLMKTIRRAHQRHHQTADKHGFEPYGLFLFPYDKFKKGFVRNDKR
jgi:beta-carotene 3-hydroxylase